MVERHVWQDALDAITAFTKTHNGKRIYGWKNQTIERSFAEAEENHGLRFARMLGIENMREQCFLTAAVQNMKRLVKAFCFACFSVFIPQTPVPSSENRDLLTVWADAYRVGFKFPLRFPRSAVAPDPPA